MDRLKIANVLERMADVLDAGEAEKQASVVQQRVTQIDKLVEQYREATGEDLPDNIRQKLASSDEDVVSLVQKMAERQTEKVESLGGPSSNRDGDALPLTKKEAADAANERFLNWAISP